MPARLALARDKPQKRPRGNPAWVRGRSANPGGLPRRNSNSTNHVRVAVEKLLREHFDQPLAALLQDFAQQHFEDLKDHLLKLAKSGDEAALEMLIKGKTFVPKKGTSSSETTAAKQSSGYG